MTRAQRALLVLASVAALLLGTSSQAQAVVGQGYIGHVADDGYDAPFLVVRQWVDGYAYGTVYEIAEGTARNDVAGVYVRQGERIVCNASGNWWVAFDAPGWHRVSNDFHYGCVAQLD